MIEKLDAILSLRPDAQFRLVGDVLTWTDPELTQPTDAEISAEVIRLQGVYDGQAYARARKAKYDLLNQDEMRYDDLVNSTTTWQDAIAAIKSANPKP
jgi:hypothetical protein